MKLTSLEVFHNSDYANALKTEHRQTRRIFSLLNQSKTIANHFA